MAVKRHASSEHDRETVAGALRTQKLRVTGPRRLILDLLMREHGPFTIDQIHERLAGHGCDRVTVYRCMTAFLKIRLVRRCDFGDDMWRYEYAGGDAHHHHHIICTACRQVETIDTCVVQGLEKLVKDKGYSDVSHSLEFFGICRACQKKAARETFPRRPEMTRRS